MKVVQGIRAARENREIIRIVAPVLEDIDFSNSGLDGCNDLRMRVARVLEEAGKKFSIVIFAPNPEGRDLGHVTRQRQYAHEAFMFPTGVYDPLYHRRKILPLDRYLRDAYPF